MNRIWLLALLVVAGCGDPQPEKEESAGAIGLPSKRTIATSTKVGPPDFNRRTPLRMVRRGEELRVGDTVDSAFKVFDAEKGASRVSELPSGWRDPLYSCAGWDAGTSGFATILFDERVALGLYFEDEATEARLQEILETYERMLEVPLVITGSRVRYWFWEQEPHRLMICAVQVPGNQHVNITISLGDTQLMDVLGMSPLIADRDRKAAERLFQEGLRSRQVDKTGPTTVAR